MIPLETIHIASPCHADWDEMDGDAQARFCRTCRKNVYNLSEMPRAEAEAFVTRMEGKLCVRFYTRADGTVLTQDCPVGLRAIRRKLVKKLSYAAALLLSCASGLVRGTGIAHAVTPAQKHTVKPQVVKTKAVKPPRGLTCTVGEPVPPRPLMGKVVPPAAMGRMQVGTPTMGAPPVPPPATGVLAPKP